VNDGRGVGGAFFIGANDCSKPRVDAYGGGAALITGQKIKSINTGEWLHREVARLERSLANQPRLRHPAGG
jgi:hypothetical protein